jgi:putative membrane protein
MAVSRAAYYVFVFPMLAPLAWMFLIEYRSDLPFAGWGVLAFLLFPYSMDALRECIAGMYRYDYIKNLAFLSIYIVVSLIIGLFLQKPFEKLNHMIERSKEKSGVML